MNKLNSGERTEDQAGWKLVVSWEKAGQTWATRAVYVHETDIDTACRRAIGARKKIDMDILNPVADAEPVIVTYAINAQDFKRVYSVAPDATRKSHRYRFPESMNPVDESGSF